MAQFDLRFQVPSALTDDVAARTLFWPPNGAGSFNTTLGPRLGALGPVTPQNVDLLRLAAIIYAADRSVPRKVGQVNWTRRTIEVTVPVHDESPWAAVSGDLEALLDFLSGDTWHLHFRRTRVPREHVSGDAHPDAQRVVLMSGGADSAIGAFKARAGTDNHVLVSHVGATSISPIQKDVAKRIRDLRPGGSVQQHEQIVFTRTQAQPGGYKFRNERSTRTRSFLFLAFGLAIASINRLPLWIPENGFASLNPPLGPDQLGSLSTRTTHPWFLSELTRIATAAGAWADITNPFAEMTKGEMFRRIADELGDDTEASTLLSATNSCAFTNRRWLGVKATAHCGTCFGCFVRRASFAAAGLADTSTYVIDAPPSDKAARQLQQASLLPSIRGFVARGIRVGDIAAMKLPAGYSPSVARDLCTRGSKELELLL